MDRLFFKEKYARFLRESPFSLARHSSIGCGGEAGTAFFPRTVEELITLAGYLQADGVPFYTVGNLTNVLPSEGRLKKTLVCTKRLKYAENADELFFPAGISSGELLNACVRLQKSGAEFLEGIPCTLGGALFMNAGVSGRYIAEIVESVTVFQDGETRVLSPKDCEYSYKKSAFMDGECVILGAKLALANASAESVEGERRLYREKRAHLPKGKSMGCVFKNPDGHIAGKLIEGAGLKGMRYGGAKISEEHANFIINDKGATAGDIRALVCVIKSAVYAQYKIRLEEEIRYLV